MDRDFALALAESDIQGANSANSGMSSSGLDLASGKNA